MGDCQRSGYIASDHVPQRSNFILSELPSLMLIPA
jgi:hypothetical protein